MTEPVPWTTKPSNTVQVMQYDGSPESTTAILDWAAPLLSGEDTSYVGGMGTPVIYSAGMWVAPNASDYVYLDDAGFHCVTQVNFEMLYKLDE